MDTADVLLGSALLLLGSAVLIAAIFRALGHAWAFGVHELWLLPVLGIGLIALGRWVML